VFGGIGTILAVVSLAYAFPQLRRFGSLQDAVPPEEGESEPPAVAMAGVGAKNGSH
jgi:hypothetical protein